MLFCCPAAAAANAVQVYFAAVAAPISLLPLPMLLGRPLLALVLLLAVPVFTGLVRMLMRSFPAVLLLLMMSVVVVMMRSADAVFVGCGRWGGCVVAILLEPSSALLFLLFLLMRPRLLLRLLFFH
jgi:hypothetical protein